MATITEDYVSFETAKLLKEKGFPQSTFRCHYIIDGNSHYKSFENICGFGNYDIIAPTLAIATKWLREVHNIYIDISPTYSEVEKTIHFIWQIFDSNYDCIGDCEIFYSKYEMACEKAIQYSLKNLI